MQTFYLSDLDKTLLRSDLSLSAYSKEVWNEALKRGARLSIATARSLTGVGKLLQGLRLNEPLIVLDGAVIARADGQILDISALSRDLADSIIECAFREFQIEPLLVSMDKDAQEQFIYPANPNRWQRELLSSFHNDRRIRSSAKVRADDQNLKLVFMEDEDRSAHLASRLKESFGDSIEIKRSADPYIECWFVTVLHPYGDKAHALAKLEAIEGVKRQNTTVFGDSQNDLGLFEVAGRKIAVSNAIKELKERADLILPRTNDEDAVAHFLAEELL